MLVKLRKKARKQEVVRRRERMEEKAKAEQKKIGMTETWLKKHRLLYNGATRHPLIISICDGTIIIASFKTWLVSKFNFLYIFSTILGSHVKM